MILTRLLAAAAMALPLCAPAQNAATTVAIDAALDRRAINPHVYGIAHAGTATLDDLNVPLNRSGGNPTTRYNWQQNADNRAADYYFQSIAYPSATPGAEGDAFIAATRAAGAEPMITIPIIGWVAKVGPGRGKLTSFSRARYPGQLTDGYNASGIPYCDVMWYPDSCMGELPGGGFVVNDPNDANVPADAAFQQGWVTHLVNRWGRSNAGGLRYYILDNEHSIWHATHRDVHPVGATMESVRDKMIAHAAAIKAVDPAAAVVGPEEWGWSGYILSGYDQQAGAANGYSHFPDRAAHGGMDYLPWLLQAFRAHHQATGQKVLDVFTVHYYPQSGEYGGNTGTAMQLMRNRSTRVLWDPDYTEESWIQEKVRLIPRLKGWVASHYLPGTPVGITEYNWGAEAHINGATTQADILGIFGREGLDMASFWTVPPASSPTYKAFKLYRNYDGAKSTFGETSVRAAVANPDQLAAFAALRADGALTVMVINKVLSGTTPVTLNLANFAGTGSAQRYQLTAANSIARLADLAFAGASIATSVPPQSITLFVLPGAPPGFAFQGAVSRKSHAGVDRDIALDGGIAIGGAVTTEPRKAGDGHRVVLRFSGSVTAAGAVAVTGAAGAPVAHTVSLSGSEIRVDLPAVQDGQRLAIAATGVNGTVDATVALAFLEGDVGSSRRVSAADIAAVKARQGQAVTALNARHAVMVGTSIGAADVAAVKARAGWVAE